MIYRRLECRDVWVVHRRIGSIAFERSEQFVPFSGNLHTLRGYRFFTTTRHPAQRFCSMYSLVQTSLRNGVGWHTYETVYPKIFTSKEIDTYFHSEDPFDESCVKNFIQGALPRLSSSIDLHWVSQVNRLRSIGLPIAAYRIVKIENLSSVLEELYGEGLSVRNRHPWQFGKDETLVVKQFDSYIRDSVWKIDYPFYLSA